MFVRRCLLILLSGWGATALTPSLAANAEPATFDPTDHYEVRALEGWSVLVNKSLIKDNPELAARTLEHLKYQLYQVVHKVPAAAVEKLRKVRIWVEENETHHPCMAYHPDAGWLREHGMNPEKARCVEVANAKNFLSWTKEQPWMVLHELSHAYHHQFLEGGFENPEVGEAYRGAMSKKEYASVLHYDGKTVAAYAQTDPQEYFAEATEAFFGANDFFPFVRAELVKHDPAIEAILAKLWKGE